MNTHTHRCIVSEVGNSKKQAVTSAEEEVNKTRNSNEED